jgi:1-phosphofructokinase
MPLRAYHFRMIHLIGFSPAVDEVLESPPLRPGAHLKARLAARQPSGKAMNVARGLGRLGVPCSITGFVGAPEVDLFRESLAGLPVQCGLIPVPAVTRRSTTVLTEEGETHLHYPSFEAPAESVAALEKYLADAVKHGDIAAICGALAPGMAPAAIGDFITLLHNAGAAVYVDTSGPALAAAIESAPDGLRINNEELDEWHELAHHGKKAGLEVDIAALMNLGVKTAMISLGKGGAVLSAGGEIFRGRCPVDGPLYTVGAGDAQFSGWLAAIHRGEADPRRQLAYALAAAAAKLGQRLPGTLDPVDVDKYLLRVEFLE